MKRLHLTSRLLAKWNACAGQRALFRRVFPIGVTITDDQERNFAAVVLAMEHDLMIVWVIDELIRQARTLGLHNADVDGDRLRCTPFDIFCPLDGNHYFRDETPPHDSNRKSGGEFALAGHLADAVGAYLKACAL